MKNNYVVYYIVCLLLVLTSCRDFIEPNIDNKIINLISPPDQYISPTVTQQFWWEELDGAESYNLQIVKGTFSYPTQLLLDSITAINKFSYSLQPGSYQWRVKGINNGGETGYSTFTLTIDSTLDLSIQTVVLTNPSSNLVTNQTVIEFKWNSLYNADEYRFQLLKQSDSTILTDQTLTTLTYSTTLTEGGYIWRVRAQNSISISPFASRVFTIDLTAPIAPNTLLPAYGSFMAVNDTISWLVDATSVADTLYIAIDSLFLAPNVIYSTNTYYLVTGSPGAYFWKVRSVDVAGNSSLFSSYSKFYIQ